MDEQIDKGNQYVGLADRQMQSIYLQWKNIQTRQSIYLRWTNSQKRKINIVTMDEQTDKGNQYTYDGRRQTRAINIPTMNE
jgi:hypothetical protein